MISRIEVVECARSWIGTPYHYGGQVKGAGADCATLIYRVYRSCGLVPEEEIGIFAGDWWLHTKDEKYMLRIVRHAYKVVEANCYRSTKAEPGNIVMLKAGNASGVLRTPPISFRSVPNCRVLQLHTLPTIRDESLKTTRIDRP